MVESEIEGVYHKVLGILHGHALWYSFGQATDEFSQEMGQAGK
jgi:hypothetical protein